MDVSLATFLVASFLFSALNKREEIESSQFVAQQRERKKEGIYLDLRLTVLRKKRKRIFSRVAITRVPTHPLLLLLLPWSSSRCPFFFRPCRSPFLQRRTFLVVGREKKTLKEKDEKKGRGKKKCARQTDRREKETRKKVFWTPCGPFQIKKSSKRIRARCSCTLTSFLLFFLRFFVFLSPKGVFIRRTSRWSRARAYISRNARSRREFLERRDEKKREKERKREREKEREEERLSSSFQTLY